MHSGEHSRRRPWWRPGDSYPTHPPALGEGEAGEGEEGEPGGAAASGEGEIGEERAVSTFQASLSHLPFLPVWSQTSPAASWSYSALVPIWTFHLDLSRQLKGLRLVQGKEVHFLRISVLEFVLQYRAVLADQQGRAFETLGTSLGGR